jgi:periplasmic protein TonB
MVAFLNITRWRFFAASVAIHIAMFLLLYPARPTRITVPETIPVSLLIPPERERPTPTPIPRAAPTRPTRVPTIIAKKDSPQVPAKSAPTRDKKSERNYTRAEVTPPEPAPPPERPTPPRETIPEQSVIAERPLPTLKELLPPVNWAATSRSDAPVSLNTRDPVYITYFNKIKQLIESQWDYPELALRYGLQGRLSLEFTIGSDGQLERLRLVRSSGSQLLDEEALRAIKAASPFPPIPPWVKPSPLSISASMEYHDNRLNYRFSR